MVQTVDVMQRGATAAVVFYSLLRFGAALPRPGASDSPRGTERRHFASDNPVRRGGSFRRACKIKLAAGPLHTFLQVVVL